MHPPDAPRTYRWAMKNTSRRRFVHASLLPAAALLMGAGKTTTRAKPQPGHRRIVVRDINGRSTIASDGPVPDNAHMVEGQHETSDVWLLRNLPVDLTNQDDTLDHYEMTAWPPLGGAVARIATWPAGFQYPMHQSETLDIVFVISGALELIVENGSTVMHAGDCVIQQGTKHGWRVVGDRPATFAGVLISGKR